MGPHAVGNIGSDGSPACIAIICGNDLGHCVFSCQLRVNTSARLPKMVALASGQELEEEASLFDGRGYSRPLQVVFHAAPPALSNGQL